MKKDNSATVIYIVDGEEKREERFNHWVKAMYFIERLCKHHENKKDLAGLAISNNVIGYFGRVIHANGREKVTTWEVWPYGWE